MNWIHRRLWRRASLRHQIARVFFLGSLATVVLATSALFLSFEREVNGRNLRVVQTELKALIARSGNSIDDLRREAAALAPRVSIRILEGDQIRFQSPGFPQVLPGVFEQRTKVRRKDHFFLLAHDKVSSLELQGALEATEDEWLLRSFRMRLLLVLGLGTAACSLLGWWAAHRALRPLSTLVETTRAINAQHLKLRLQTEDVPQELSDLVHSLNIMLDRLDASFERLSRFSADLAHELRTPIAALIGETEVMLGRDRSPEEYRQVLESSLEEYRRLSRLIGRMLTLARMEDTEHLSSPTELEAAPMVADVLDCFEAACEERDIHLVGSGEGQVFGDGDLLRQVLVNLVSNALEATDPGGTIAIEIRPEPSGACLSVRDTGRGIPSDALPHVFERFFRLGTHRGTGLGLAIVQSIVRLHRGTLDLQSEPGRGTLVQIHLPASSGTLP